MKEYYYEALIKFYSFCGLFTDQVAANSSWTREHLDKLWGLPDKRIKTLYPPCGVEEFQSLDLDNRENIVVSFAQFRPEKEHLK